MLFSSLVFIQYFLPIVAILYFAVRNLKVKNGVLLAGSIFFYAWGEPKYVILMLISIGINYVFGLWMEKYEGKSLRRWLLALCVLINLGLLGYFKYFNFFFRILSAVAGREILAPREIALPIGISFYTFQALSYVLDVYRGQNRAQKNPWYLALYISFFPQLIAGPIVKYHDIEEQIGKRTVSLQKAAYGIKRFTYGLAKKVILANTFAFVVDRVFGNAPNTLGTKLIWFTLVLYALQIYYDFSGYSDMAIGLGSMFGFRFMENFNYPYMSSSIREFWRRWHISLSTWFREYLYIPLGGNRKGNVRTYVNLFIVFLATGLWHGAGANFVLWGVYYGVFIVAERLFLGKWLEKNPVKILNHVYAMFVVLIGWLLFRIESLDQIRALLSNMVHMRQGLYTVRMFADNRVFFLMAVGLLLCGPLQAVFGRMKSWLYDEERIGAVDVVVMAALLFLCVMLLVNNTYNPFIYFRF